MKKRLCILILCLAVTVVAVTLSAAPASEKTPSQVVDGFYTWYFKNVPAIDPVKGPADTPDTVRRNFSQAKDFFQPELYTMLAVAFQKGPSDGDWIDVDPFINAQMGARGYRLGSTAVKGDTATVLVNIIPGRGTQERTIPVELTKSGGAWRISNFIYQKDFTLSSWLKKMKYFKK